jgi:DNA-binding PadR family transcriptional regulator
MGRTHHEHDHLGHEHHEHDEAHEHGHHEHGPWAGRGGRGWERGGWGGMRRMRRGDIRRAVLAALREGPAHGYAVMQRLEDMSGGLWRPSPGSVYPHLQMLEDEGLVASEQKDGTRTFHLTEAGTAAAAGAGPGWQTEGQAGEDVRSLRTAVLQLMGAAKQLSGAGSEEQVARGVAVVQRARKEIYQILAED